MMAIHYSRHLRLLLSLVFIGSISAAELDTTRFRRRAESAYRAGQVQFQKNSNEVQIAWQLGRACFDWADFASNHVQRAAIAHEGIEACQHATSIDSSNAPAYYYLGLNLGQLAQAKRMSALHVLDEMEAALLAAVRWDPAFDYAGPHRSLGLLYKDAPGWPISLGSRAKARTHLQRALALAPDYPDNQLSWLEAQCEWSERKKAQSELGAVALVLQTARQKLVGEDWTSSWQDWDARWQALQIRVQAPGSRSSRP